MPDNPLPPTSAPDEAGVIAAGRRVIAIEAEALGKLAASLDAATAQQVERALLDGELKLLYVAPEGLEGSLRALLDGVRVSLVGIEILTIEARVVIASVDTFLHYAREISKIEQAEEEGDLDDLEDIEIEASAESA